MEAKVSPTTTTSVIRDASQPGCESELSNLRTRFKEMTTLCRQLQDNLEYLENKTKRLEMQAAHAQLEAKSDDSTSPGAYDFASLKEKMKELVAMNLNWQKFSQQQERHTLELNDKVALLEKELAAKSTGQLSESQQIEYDQLLLAKKHMCNSLEEEKNQVEEENFHLRRQAVTAEKAQDEYKERCQLLEAQLVMYQEDFKHERADRERAQSRIDELEIQLSDFIQRQQVPVTQVSKTLFNPTDSYANRTSYAYPQQNSEDTLRGRGVGLYQTDGAGDASSLHTSQATKKLKSQGVQRNRAIVVPTSSIYQTDGVDESDCFAIELMEDGPSRHIALDDMLSCPKCCKVYTRDRHLELLEHMEDCN